MTRFSFVVVSASLLLAGLLPQASAMEPLVLSASRDVSLDQGIQAEQAHFNRSSARLSQGPSPSADQGNDSAQQKHPQAYSVLDLSF